MRKMLIGHITKYFYVWLFAISILIYLWTHLIRIEDFPIYFFTDEALFPATARELIKNGLRDSYGNLFPLLILGEKEFPAFFVYLQMLTTGILGNKIWVVRATTVIISLLGGIFLSLTLRSIFKVKNYWIGTLFLATIPLFFLHSRTGFETVAATSFYTIGLYFYLQYRNGKMLRLFLSLLFFSISFYTYFGIWLTIGLTLFFLTIIDLDYHLKHLKTLSVALAFAFFLFVPFLKFQIAHFSNTLSTLKGYDLSLVKNSVILPNIIKVFQNYLEGLNLKTLFFYDPQLESTHLVRHVMKWYGFFPMWSLPIIFIGLIKTAATLKNPLYRILIVALVAAPAGSFVGFGATRIMPLVVPMTLLFGIGINVIYASLLRIFPFLITKLISIIILFITLGLFAVYLCYDSIHNGALWFNNYGFYGLQYGAKQIFQDYIRHYLAFYPKDNIILSPNWSNGTDVFLKFFFTEEQKQRIKIKNVLDFTLFKEQLDDKTVFILTFDEFANIKTSSKFKKISILDKIDYPNHKPGFYIVKLTYIDTIDEVMKKELEKRKELIEENVKTPDGNKIKASYSLIDGGTINNIFDRNTDSLIKGFEANPFILEITYNQPRTISSVSLNLAAMDFFTIRTVFFQKNKKSPQIFSKSYSGLPPDPYVKISFNSLIKSVKKLRIEIKYHQGEERANIHVRELDIR